MYRLPHQFLTEETMKKKHKVIVQEDSNLEMAGNDEMLEKIDTLRRAVGNELVDLAISKLEPKYSLADLESMLDKMLR